MEGPYVHRCNCVARGAQRLIFPIDQEVRLAAVCGAAAPHRARPPHGAEPLRGAAAPHRRTPPQSGTAPHRRLAYEKIGTADFNLKSSEPGASTARRRVLRGLTGITVATRRFRSLRGLSVREMFRQQFRVSDEQASNQNRGLTVLSTLVMWE